MLGSTGLLPLAKRLVHGHRTDQEGFQLSEFKSRGVVHFKPCNATKTWLKDALPKAEAAYRSVGCTYEYDGTWVQYHGLRVSLPPNRDFHRFLRRLFPRNRKLACDLAHLSSLNPGYPASDDRRRRSLGRHVDGAISPGKVMWHGAIIGVLLTDVVDLNCGNPVSWPGSHFETRDTFAQLGSSVTEAELSQLIAEQCTAPINSAGEQLIAEAGTTVVMDHALHHGMAPNESKAVRHAIYYRLPWLGTSRPCDILNPDLYRVT